MQPKSEPKTSCYVRVNSVALEIHLLKAAFNFNCQLLGIAGLDKSFFSPIVSLYKDTFKPMNTFSVLGFSIFKKISVNFYSILPPDL